MAKAAPSVVDKQLMEEIEKTQQILNYVRRPPLSVKLLSKPPFKFIHDLAAEVMKLLGEIPRRLFTDQEMDKNSFAVKEQKLVYLEKLIRWTSFLIGREVDVNPKSILTGKEATKTNRLLQEINHATKIAEGEPARGEAAADYANGKGVSATSASSVAPASRSKSREKEGGGGGAGNKRRPRTPDGGALESDEDDALGPRIIEEKTAAGDEDDFQVVEVAEGRVRTKQLNQREKLKDAKDVDDFEDHGILVRKILEMKRGIEEMEREGQRDEAGSVVAGGGAESEVRQTDLDHQQRERDAIRCRRDIADLRRKIQTLAACVTPMGREMDEVQIAVDVMLQEHAKWRDENAFLRERLVQERTASTASLAPLMTKLRILQADIDDKEEHIRSQKRTIQFNDDKIRRILNKGLTLTQGLQSGKDLSRR